MNQKELTKTVMMVLNGKNPLISMAYTKKNQRFNPLTAGAVHTRFLHFLLAYYISGFKLKDKT